MVIKKIITLSKSEFIESFLYLNGNPINLDMYRHMRPIFNTQPDRSVVLMQARETTKSSTLAELMVCNAVLLPKDPTVANPIPGGFTQMYVAPRVDQTKVFSYDRLNPLLESPFIKKYFLSSNLVQNVFSKQFTNRAKLHLRYALHDADGLRSFSQDAVFYDECYSKDTEILTENGWKLFKDLLVQEKVATVNQQTNLVEFCVPDKYINYKYTGELIQFKHRSFKLQTTPHHLMRVSQELKTGYYKNPKIKGWNLKEAETLTKSNFKMNCKADWLIQKKENFEITVYTSIYNSRGNLYQNNKTINIDGVEIKYQSFCKFLGWYLAEGCTEKASNKISITQSKTGKHYKKLVEDLDALNLNIHCFSGNNGKVGTFYFSNRAIADYLKILGNSFTKYIPQEILNNNLYLLELLDCLYCGDAMHYIDKEHMGELNTASEKLSNTVQEAWLRLGVRATIRQITEKSGTIMYRVKPLEKDYLIFWNNSTNHSEISRIDYDDEVYCVNVKNNQIFVRDKTEKTPVICGNCQDLVPDIVPVANQGMSRSYYKWNYFAGTPKLSVGTLQTHWDMSTKNEYMPRCGACSKYNYIDEKNVGKHGLICRYCGHILDPRTGTWVRMAKSDPKNYHEGFRISQLHFYGAPWVDWERDIISVYENQSRSIFYNEVLALPYDEGSVPITPDEVKACCTGMPLTEVPNERMDLSRLNFAGLDYGPENSANSFSLLTIIQPQPNGQKRLLYAKRYTGEEAKRVFIHQDVPKQLKKWGAVLLGSDYGLGEGSNGEIRERIGQDKLIPYFHSQSQKARKSWNSKVGVFILNRNTVMTEFFQDVKKGKWVFPEWESFELIARDILNVQLQIDEKKQRYMYTNTKPDDLIHSLIFASETAELGAGLY